MLSIEKLKEFGANTEEGLTRCFQKEDFYLMLVKMLMDEPNFALLEEKLEEKDLDGAFEAAHGLKGVVANLAITPLLTPVNEITELLRARTDMDYSDLREQIREKREELRKIIEEE